MHKKYYSLLWYILKEDIPKRKTSFFLFFKAFEISSNYLLLYGHFNIKMKTAQKNTRTLTIFVQHGIMAHDAMMDKPMKTLAVSNDQELVINNYSPKWR